MKKFIILLFVYGTTVLSVQAQCCSAGNPFFYGEQANIGYKQLQIIAGYKYSMSDQYYQEDSKVEIDFIDKSYFNFLNLQMIYGITNRLSVKADLGYFLNRTEQYKLENWETINGYGIGDGGLTVRYLAYKSFKRKFSVIPSVGIILPIGVFDQEVDHIKLPITVQPSSGSLKYLLNLYVNKTSQDNKFNLGFYGSVELPKQIDSENFYYKYGNLYLFSFVGSYFLSHKTTIGLELRNENRNKASRENDQIVESSGFNIVYIAPHFSYAFAKNWFAAINTDIPVFKYYNGIQLSNKFSVAARISYNIHFSKSKLEKVMLN